MPANGVVTGSVPAESLGTEKLIPYFTGLGGDSYQTNPFWYVKEIVFPIGIKPGYAIVNIPTLSMTGSENANQVAFTQNITKNIKHGSGCGIKRKSKHGIGQTIFVGTVVEISHDRDTDGIAIKVVDDRYLLQDINIVGRFTIHNWHNATSTPLPITYQQGYPCRFNPEGRPNCIIGPGGIPVFTPFPDFNIGQDEEPPESGNDLTLKASYWTIARILKYLRTFYSEGSGYDSYTANFPWIKKLLIDSDVTWDINFGANIDNEAVSNFDSARGGGYTSIGGQRKGRDIDITDMSLLDALDLILTTAGGWTVSLEPNHVLDLDNSTETFGTVLKAVPSRYTGGGIDIQFQAGGNKVEKAIVTGGSYSENSEDLFTYAVVQGDLVRMESRVDTATGTLIPLWSTEDELAFRQYWGTYPDDDGFREACIKYPDVYTMYRLSPDWNYYGGTSFSNYPRAKYGKIIETALLSWRGNENSAQDFATMRYPIPVEFKDTSGNWQSAPLLDGLELFDTGTIYLPGLRDAQISWSGAGVDAIVAGYATMTKRDIRMTVAVPMDHRVTALASYSNEAYNDQFFDVINECPDRDRIDTTLHRQHLVTAGSLYKLWLRNTSYPIPASVNGAAQFENKQTLTNPLRSDADLLLSHARRSLYDFGRLLKTGLLRIDGYVCSEYQPGTPVRNLVPYGVDGMESFPIRAVIGQVKWVCIPGDIHTELVLI